ncbi:hypothetical protein IE077_002690 [Cardiosporidium cionae]|uniref:Uncharacterized protein n=1 Tax=Cardiosporidium cionae TaxID=476202 RepID=A0ABQ7J579_9APIC|nr:hypothetical protein IE077_002690 [Cardiosporidium cionae]|eukprot:KAF8817941.1 hypothetical protein IE077_002690 [Cardiosporidium cionae]
MATPGIPLPDGIEWLYANPAAEPSQEDYLLGKPISGANSTQLRSLPFDKKAEVSDASNLQDSSTLPVRKLNEDSLRRLREDPLFIIRQMELQQQRLLESHPLLQKQKHLSKKVKKRSEGYSEEKHRNHRTRERNEQNNPSFERSHGAHVTPINLRERPRDSIYCIERKRDSERKIFPPRRREEQRRRQGGFFPRSPSEEQRKRHTTPIASDRHPEPRMARKRSHSFSRGATHTSSFRGQPNEGSRFSKRRRSPSPSFYVHHRHTQPSPPPSAEKYRTTRHPMDPVDPHRKDFVSKREQTSEPPLEAPHSTRHPPQSSHRRGTCEEVPRGRRNETALQDSHILERVWQAEANASKIPKSATQAPKDGKAASSHSLKTERRIGVTPKPPTWGEESLPVGYFSELGPPDAMLKKAEIKWQEKRLEEERLHTLQKETATMPLEDTAEERRMATFDQKIDEMRLHGAKHELEKVHRLSQIAEKEHLQETLENSWREQKDKTFLHAANRSIYMNSELSLNERVKRSAARRKRLDVDALEEEK